MSRFTEPDVEDAPLAWLESLGCPGEHGLEIAPGELAASQERARSLLVPRNK